MQNEKLEKKPKLAIVLASNDEPSLIYTNLKKQIGINNGFEVEIFEFTSKQSTKEILVQIQKLNIDASYHGILVQLPLLNKFEKDKNNILNCISPEKDVDGLTNSSLGNLYTLEKQSLIPATVLGILEIIFIEYNLPLEKIYLDIPVFNAKSVLIINNSNLIGRPLCTVLSGKGATVTLANHTTIGIDRKIKDYDIVISGTGKGKLWDTSLAKDNALLIDVTSIKMPHSKKVYGDFISAGNNVILTAVPGGVGPLTISSLFQNLSKAYSAIVSKSL